MTACNSPIRVVSPLLCGLVAICISITVHATTKPVVVPEQEPAVQWTETDIKGFDSGKIALDQGLQLERYKTFTVLQPTLEFDKHWLRDYKREMTKKDEERLRESYTAALRQALEETLSKELGWQLVSDATADTLVVVPSLTRFRITAPDLSFRPNSKDYVHYSGAARLDLQLRDGGSSAPLVALSDHSQTRAFGGVGDLKPTNRVENLRDFKILSKRWASRLTDYLKTQTKN
ncbi:MAG: DUF3313 family protein [Cellvibrionaceae bacterium]|nr:DUF3313 family protein [Cellvibrionaceae bacterium]